MVSSVLSGLVLICTLHREIPNAYLQWELISGAAFNRQNRVSWDLSCVVGRGRRVARDTGTVFCVHASVVPM